MFVQCTCPGCHHIFTVRRVVLGKRTKCTECGEAFLLTESKVETATPPLATPIEEAPEASHTPAPSEQWQTPTAGPVPTATVTPPTPPAQPTPPPPPPPEPLEDWTKHEGLAYGHLPPDREQRPSPARPRFYVLRLVARGYEVAAAVSAAVAVIVVIVLMIQLIRQPTLAAVVPTLLASGLTFFWTIMFGVGFLFMAQMIRLALQIEENTHATRKAAEETADAVRELSGQIKKSEDG